MRKKKNNEKKKVKRRKKKKEKKKKKREKKVCKFCRSGNMLKNDFLLAKFGVDTAENEPLRARHRARTNIGKMRNYRIQISKSQSPFKVIYILNYFSCAMCRDYDIF